MALCISVSALYGTSCPLLCIVGTLLCIQCTVPYIVGTWCDVTLQANRVGERLADKKMRLELTEAALEHLAKVSYDPVYGARWV
eukprot:1137795-Pelagomonas_calceolata.AAC.5